MGYVVRRLLLAVPTLLGLSVLIFVLSDVAGDPTDRLAARDLIGDETEEEVKTAARERFGLDDPLPVRYTRWLGESVRGDLGTSLFTGTAVRDDIRQAFPATVGLAAASLVLIVALAVTSGALAVLFDSGWRGHALRLIALAGASIPGFFLAYLLIDVFAVRLRLLPVAGSSGLRSVVLPALALAGAPAALVSRLLRARLLDVLGEDFIRTARAKGLAAVPVLIRHALRNAAVPVVTVLGNVLGRMLEGAVVIEVIFSWPGMGRLTYQAVTSYDYPLIQGVVVFGGVMFILLNLLVDLSYVFIDPRVRLGDKQ